ncbi:hypothetical protein HMI55_006856 [Coelomomyces lativittatus]|nr:hypothetical protein HMI56_006771 [Coelomomyces lativittatus]KAJ1518330.1 hypothetical protein HMI55_006856 [Coelomomyces lativittatus]
MKASMRLPNLYGKCKQKKASKSQAEIQYKPAKMVPDSSNKDNYFMLTPDEVKKNNDYKNMESHKIDLYFTKSDSRFILDPSNFKKIINFYKLLKEIENENVYDISISSKHYNTLRVNKYISTINKARFRSYNVSLVGSDEKMVYFPVPLVLSTSIIYGSSFYCLPSHCKT